MLSSVPSETAAQLCGQLDLIVSKSDVDLATPDDLVSLSSNARARGAGAFANVAERAAGNVSETVTPVGALRVQSDLLALRLACLLAGQGPK